jgi:hypothetical protein
MNTESQPIRKFNIVRRLPASDPAITFVLEEPESTLCTNIPALTRYLYIHTDVEHTIRHCFTNAHSSSVDEVLYWTYELYFSGFIVETIEILSSIYNAYFDKTHGKQSAKFQAQIAALMENESKHECIATIVHNLFVCMRRLRTNGGPLLWITYSRSQIHKYCNKSISSELPVSEFVATIRRYSVESPDVQLYDKVIDSTNWVYYASYAPLWRKRLALFRASAVIDHEKETVCFRTDGFQKAFGYQVERL